jgi:hypothetical protein
MSLGCTSLTHAKSSLRCDPASGSTALSLKIRSLIGAAPHGDSAGLRVPISTATPVWFGPALAGSVMSPMLPGGRFVGVRPLFPAC